MRVTVLSAGAVCIALYLALCAVMYHYQRALIYHPQPRSLPPGQSMLVLPSEGADVVVTVRPRPGAQALLYFGGNAEDVAYTLPELARAFPDHALYLMHYRGYGGSGGEPSEAALVADATRLFDLAHAEHTHVVAVGRSLGSGVAVQLAGRRPVSRLVLVTPYDSLAGVAQRHYPWLPVRWLLKDKFDSAALAPGINVPTRIIAAERDEVIPIAHAQALAARFGQGVVAYSLVKGAGHNTISNSPEYVQLLQQGVHAPAAPAARQP